MPNLVDAAAKLANAEARLAQLEELLHNSTNDNPNEYRSQIARARVEVSLVRGEVERLARLAK